MSDSVIDTLSLEIESNSNGADKAIDRLVNSLMKLEKGMTGLQNMNFNGLTGGVKKLAASTKGLEVGKITAYSAALTGLSGSVKQFAGAGKQINPAIANLQKLAGFDFSKLQIKGDFSGFSGLAKGSNEFAEAAVKLSAVKPVEINRAAKALEKLGNINLSGLAESIRSLNGTDFSVLNNLGTAFQSFTGSLAGSEKVPAAVSKIFISLTQLATSAGNIPVATSNLPALSTEVQRFISAMATAPIVQSGTATIVTALSGLANAGGKAQKTVQALPGLTKGVQDFISALSNVPKLNTDTLRAVEALSQLSNAGGRAGAAARNLQKNVGALTGAMSGLKGGAGRAVTGLKSFSGQLLSMVGLAGGLYGLTQAIKSSIGYASNLAEAENVVAQGFGPMISKVETFAQTSVQSLGMSELAAKRTAGIYAVMGKSLGILPEQAADMAISLTELTSDMASFYNVSQNIADTALKSVFTGETESLKKFGVVMTESNLKAYALSQGITKNISAMSQMEKTMLRYQYVMSATADVQGDFARTAGGSWANQVRILTEQFRQLASILGSGLMTALLPVVKGINTVMSKIVQLASVISGFLAKLFGIRKAAANSGAGLAGVADAAGMMAENTEAAAGGIADAGNAAKKAEKKVNSFVASWHEVTSMSSNEDQKGTGGGAGGITTPDMSLPAEYEMGLTVDDEIGSKLEAIRKRFLELFGLFKTGFKIGFGDLSVFDSIRDNLRSIKDSLLNIFTDRQVIASFNGLMDTLAYNAGLKVGAFVSVGATLADNLTGGIALYLSEARGRIRDWLISTFGTIGETDAIVANFMAAVADIFTAFRSGDAKAITGDIIQIFSDAFMGITELSAKLGRDILALILNPITENSGKMKEALLNTLGPVEEIIGTVADSFTNLWTTANQIYDEHIKPLLDALTGGLSQILESLLNGYNQFVAPTLEKLGGTFAGVWQGTIEPLLNNIMALLGDLADMIKVLWNNVLQPVLNWVATAIVPIVAPIIEVLGDSFLALFKTIGEIADGFITTMRGIINFVTGVFSLSWGKAWGGIGMVFKGVWEGLVAVAKVPLRVIIGLVNSMIAGVEGGINAVISSLNMIHFDIPSWIPGLGGKSFGINLSPVWLPRIPQLAEGGYIRKATLAMIGEDGPEAVLPLKNNTQWMDALSDRIVDGFSQYKNVRLANFDDLSNMAKEYRPNFSQTDARNLQRTMRMEYDVQMAQQAYDLQQQNQLLAEQNQLLRAILEKPALQDQDIFRASQRGQSMFNARTGRTGWAGVD